MTEEKANKRKSCLVIASVIIILLLILVVYVGREVATAFRIVDEALHDSTGTYAASNEVLKDILLEDDVYSELVKDIEATSLEFNSLIDSTINQLVLQSGGWKDGTDEKELFDPKNARVPTRILIMEGIGDVIEQAVATTGHGYNRILHDELKIDSVEIPLKINAQYKGESDITWTEYNFDQLPLMAVIPLLKKLKRDENESVSIIYQEMAKKG